MVIIVRLLATEMVLGNARGCQASLARSLWPYVRKCMHAVGRQIPFCLKNIQAIKKVPAYLVSAGVNNFPIFFSPSFNLHFRLRNIRVLSKLGCLPPEQQEHTWMPLYFFKKL